MFGKVQLLAKLAAPRVSTCQLFVLDAQPYLLLSFALIIINIILFLLGPKISCYSYS